MTIGRRGGRPLIVLAALSMAAGALVFSGGPASADVTCPTVNPTTGAVSPTPSAGVDWQGCYLANAALYGADLANANLSQALLTGANLGNANLDGANLGLSDLVVHYVVCGACPCPYFLGTGLRCRLSHRS